MDDEDKINDTDEQEEDTDLDYDDSDYDDDEQDGITAEREEVLPDHNNCCLDKCLLTFDEEFKSRLKSDLSLLSKKEKQIYLFALISKNEQKKICSKSSRPFLYSVKVYGVSRSVCKSAFVLLHDTTISTVRNLCKKMCKNNLIPIDNRGKHYKQVTIPEQKKELIKTHFFHSLESPTIFKCTKKRLGRPNINKLWNDFKQHYGNLSRATYTKYIYSLLTPEVLTKFMCANEAKQILINLRKYEKKY